MRASTAESAASTGAIFSSGISENSASSAADHAILASDGVTRNWNTAAATSCSAATEIRHSELEAVTDDLLHAAELEEGARTEPA